MDQKNMSKIFQNEISHEILIRRTYPRDEDMRGYYFRDTTAIIHSYPFRRLKNKTQVFFTPKNDHICTRIEHVMHVATIAATICKALNLNADLAWAISLGHDLGHTPFGHVGEEIINDLVKYKGGFIHEVYSLRVVDHLVNYGKGLNLTYAVRDGIINHCGEKFERIMAPDFSEKDLSSINKRNRFPSTWEGVVVRMSDKIAYLGRDIEDAIHLKLVKQDEIPKRPLKLLGRTNSEIIDTLVKDLTDYSLQNGVIGFSEKIYTSVLELKDFNYSHIYSNKLLANYHAYFRRILSLLFEYLENLFQNYGLDAEKYSRENNLLSARFADFIMKMKSFYENTDGGYNNLVLDYIAGMTDDFAIDSIEEIMIPRRFAFEFEDLLMKKLP